VPVSLGCHHLLSASISYRRLLAVSISYHQFCQFLPIAQRTTNGTSKTWTASTRCAASEGWLTVASGHLLACQELDQKVYEKNFQTLEEWSVDVSCVQFFIAYHCLPVISLISRGKLLGFLPLKPLNPPLTGFGSVIQSLATSVRLFFQHRFVSCIVGLILGSIAAQRGSETFPQTSTTQSMALLEIATDPSKEQLLCPEGAWIFSVRFLSFLSFLHLFLFDSLSAPHTRQDNVTKLTRGTVKLCQACSLHGAGTRTVWALWGPLAFFKTRSWSLDSVQGLKISYDIFWYIMIYDMIYYIVIYYHILYHMYWVNVIPSSQLLAQVVGVFPGARMNDGTEAAEIGKRVKP
jgi:hypothetical protein